jgi:hypothetical protein
MSLATDFITITADLRRTTSPIAVEAELAPWCCGRNGLG